MKIKRGFWEYSDSPYTIAFYELKIEQILLDTDDPEPDDGCYGPPPEIERELLQWCKENCSGKIGYSYTSGFGFYEESDYMAFKLRWM